MMQAVQAQSVETWSSGSMTTGIDRSTDRSSTMMRSPQAERMGAAAFDLALQDELARDRSFHIHDGQFRLCESTIFDGTVQPHKPSETVDPSSAHGGLRPDFIGGGPALASYNRVAFEAKADEARKADDGDLPVGSFEPSADAAFWVGNDLAVSPVFSSGISGFQDTLPVDTHEADQVFFNGDGRPILVPVV